LKKTVKNMNLSENHITSSCSVMSAFVRKLSKRRCVSYLAKDGLSPPQWI
jgi:hypothetical protein